MRFTFTQTCLTSSLTLGNERGYPFQAVRKNSQIGKTQDLMTVVGGSIIVMQYNICVNQFQVLVSGQDSLITCGILFFAYMARSKQYTWLKRTYYRTPFCVLEPLKNHRQHETEDPKVSEEKRFCHKAWRSQEKPSSPLLFGRQPTQQHRLTDVDT